MKEKILVAMSGGVDSSSVASKLLEDGYDVEGITLSFGKFCSSLAVIDAKKVADQLKIKHHVLMCEENFENKVIKYFANEYIRGNTPNPCVKCNREVKFFELLKFKDEIGAKYLATGHYANIVNHGDVYWLERAFDVKKDQTYFLGQLKYEYLQYIKFPLCGITKDNIRKYANNVGLIVANKAESQNICFSNGKNYKDIVKSYFQSKPGDIVYIKTGQKIGKHSGIINYTQGQRRGINIGGFLEPIYVVDFDPNDNIVYVGEEEYLFKSELKINGINLLDLNLEINIIYNVTVKVRSEDIPEPATVMFCDNKKAIIKLLKPSRNISRGQLCAIYNGNRLIASGFIE